MITNVATENGLYNKTSTTDNKYYPKKLHETLKLPNLLPILCILTLNTCRIVKKTLV